MEAEGRPLPSGLHSRPGRNLSVESQTPVSKTEEAWHGAQRMEEIKWQDIES